MQTRYETTDDCLPVPDAVLTALDSLRVAITIYDRDHALLYANRHFNYLFPSLPQRKQLLGLRYDALVRREIAGGEIAAGTQLSNTEAFVARRVAQLRDDSYAPMDIHLANGRKVEIKVRPVAGVGHIALWSDVTQARHTMQRLEDAVELSADAFVFYDANDRLLTCNNEFARLIGAEAPETLTGMRLADVLMLTARNGAFTLGANVEQWITNRMDQRRHPAGLFSLSTRDGGTYLVRDRSTRDGGRAVVFTDITDSRRTEAALDEQTKALERAKTALARSENEARKQARYLADLSEKLGAVQAEAGTAKTAFLRTMSHELKTPLNAIIGFADLLRNAPGRFSAEQLGEYAELIHGAGNNLLRLLNQILDLTKIAAGRYELNRSTIESQCAVRTACDAVCAMAADKAIVLDESAVPGACPVNADEGALTAMLQQLLENAIHFSPVGSTVRLIAGQENGGTWLSVCDNGPGVAAKDLPRILEPFEQVGRGTADHSGGAGLGLTLVKALAELQDGALTLASEPGKGFTATITLPAA
jgi:two-component system cell cycle sensor histidine kinase PleC